MTDEFLEHHGVKGMKWGHRKQRASTSSSMSKKGNAYVYLGKHPRLATRNLKPHDKVMYQDRSVITGQSRLVTRDVATLRKREGRKLAARVLATAGVLSIVALQSR